MIFVGDHLFSGQYQGDDTVLSLLDHPSVVSSSNSFKDLPLKKVSRSQVCDQEKLANTKYVYVFQREFATVDPGLVEFVGTDEATTCIGLVIRNRESRMTSVAHMDSSKIVEMGLVQMLSRLADPTTDSNLDVHMIGGFDDACDRVKGHGVTSGFESHEKRSGYSLPLVSKIIEVLMRSERKFHLQTLCILKHNTRRDSLGNSCPVVSGVLVKTSTGTIAPAIFDMTSRCPDEIVRRLRVCVSSLDPQWKGKLLETYDTHHDKIVIAPCTW